MKLIFIANYLPRQCGIAIFTHDLVNALKNTNNINIEVAAMNNRPEGYNYSDIVTFEIPQYDCDAYRKLADYINISEINLVCVQHEFGIFGGEQGSFILQTLKNIQKPIVTVLHTIINRNDPELVEYGTVLEEIIKLSTKIVVINNKGKDILIDQYDIPIDKIFVIPHGIEDVPLIDPNYYKNDFNFIDKTILMTFGLISPNKGLETVIKALPDVIKQYPNVIYLIVGVTHPEVKRLYGEHYRESLKRKINELHLTKNVIFINEFLEKEELAKYICMCDIYISPYPKKNQISSGTLVKAVGSGKAVISTPFWHAEELLSDGRGVFVEFNDLESMKNAILRLIEDKNFRNSIRGRAYKYGRKLIWKEVGKTYYDLFKSTIQDSTPVEKVPTQLLNNTNITLKYLRHLTDSTSIFQHATCSIPNKNEGYCTDDVTRALIVVLNYQDRTKSKKFANLVSLYLNHIMHAQNKKGLFRNTLSFSRHWLDTQGTEDTQGRVLWALGTTISKSKEDRFRILANKILKNKFIENLSLTHVRPLAYAINGLYEISETFPDARKEFRLLKEFSNKLIEAYEENMSNDWQWFEPIVTYGNAKIPEALFLASELLNKEIYLEVAERTLMFLINIQYDKERDIFNFIGNQGFYPKDGTKAVFSQQPINAAYLVNACLTAYRITGNKEYFIYAKRAYIWFLGRNILHKPLYDEKIGCCYDGIDEFNISLNNGAESSICYLNAAIHLSRYNEKPISKIIARRIRSIKKSTLANDNLESKSNFYSIS